MARDLQRLLLRANIQPGEIKEARKAWQDFRAESGRGPDQHLLTEPLGNAKFTKTSKTGIMVYGLSLAPHDLSVDYNACRYSTPECRRGCVAFAGRGQSTMVIDGRILRTQFLAQFPQEFVTLLSHEIGRAKRKHGKALRVRLNTFSDICWETVAPWLFVEHKDVKFYDYTKVPVGHRNVPSNYRLTYSASERTTDAEIRDSDSNIAVVFAVKRSEDLPKRYLGRPVIDGDASDDRYLDRPGRIVGLRAKGKMTKLITRGMVREVA